MPEIMRKPSWSQSINHQAFFFLSFFSPEKPSQMNNSSRSSFRMTLEKLYVNMLSWFIIS